MVDIREETTEEIKRLKREKKTINQKIKELEPKAVKTCSFCQKPLKTDKNNYLKNRYKCKFWNNNTEDKRLICFPCLKYAYTRGLPLISAEKQKKKIFKVYVNRGYFKEV